MARKALKARNHRLLACKQVSFRWPRRIRKENKSKEMAICWDMFEPWPHLSRNIPDWDGFMVADAMTMDVNWCPAPDQFQKWPESTRWVAEQVSELISEPPYVYSKFDAKIEEIRLLKINPSKLTTRTPSGTYMSITCELEHFALYDSPNYAALSYVWGTQCLDHLIIVNGHPLHVTNNLFFALHYLYSNGIHGWIWIDAICINQNDLPEKSLEVQRMRQIYQKADTVIAWLGVSPRKDDTTLPTLGRLNKSLELEILSFYAKTNPSNVNYQEQCAPRAEASPDLAIMSALASNEQLVRDLVSKSFSTQHESGTENLNAVARVFRSKLWSRIWIIQEIASAQSVLLMYEQEQMPLEHLLIVWAVLYWHANAFPTPFHYFNFENTLESVQMKAKFVAPLILQYKAWPEGQKSRCLFELLRATGGFDASDPRDRIFALLGLASDASQLNIIPNYSKDYVTICVETAHRLIQNHGLSILSFTGPSKSAFRSLPRFIDSPLSKSCCKILPSWVPDWDLPRFYSIVSDRARGCMPFVAGGSPLKQQPQFDKERQIISISICWVGRVTKVSNDKQGVEEEKDRTLQSVASSKLARLKALATNAFKLPPKEPGLEDVIFSVSIAAQKPHDSSTSARQHDKLVAGFGIICTKADNQQLADEELDVARPYLLEVDRRAKDRTTFICNDQYLCLGPEDVEINDMVCLVLGADVPYVVRPNENGTYELLDEAYVHGIMYGEFFSGKIEREVVKIILA